MNVVGIRRIVISKRGGSLPYASQAAHEVHLQIRRSHESDLIERR
ncbi:hypothetical protein PCH70_45150 [Pseudomonas cichorii JBC1]|nr:hypothetical protein PCH70_45150 [Pseudomonas cichorii JBC1]